MTKTERIAQLEAQVKALERAVTEQAIRIGILEARPLVMPQWTYKTPEPMTPPFLFSDDNITVTYPSWSPAYAPSGHIATRTYSTDQCVEELYI